MSKRLAAIEARKQLAAVAPKRLAIETPKLAIAIPKQLAIVAPGTLNDVGETACVKLTYDYGIRLTRLFFDQSCVELAKALLGKLIVRECDGEMMVVRIVETEAYPIGEDTASPSFIPKRTARNEAMFMDPGTAYVYNIYGNLQCFNVTSKGCVGSAVLIRAAEPLFGMEAMTRRRNLKYPNRMLKPRDMCSGPSKLCQALAITKPIIDKSDTTVSEQIFFANDSFVVDQSDIVVKGRIGLETYGAELATLPLRFYIRDNVHVSVK
uniref:DNA-3-methyladenine glycosylase n=1 Tax=Plectus sambesii TaxID=2011161 RepID=A0A914VJS5_9BILA